MIEPTIHTVDTLSKSSVSTYLRCGQQWFYAYVLRMRRPPTIRQAIGLAGHSAVEANYTQKVITGQDVPMNVVTDVFSDEWDEMAHDMVPDEDEDQPSSKDSGIKAVRTYHSEVAPGVQPVWVEHPVMFEVDGVPYSGWIDLADDKGRVRDTKFVAKTPSRVSQEHVLAMTGYALAYRQETGQIESEVQLDNIVRLKKEPKYVPIPSGGPISDEMIGKFAHTVKGVSAAIQKGVFLPNGLQNNSCSWCGFRDICPAYKEAR